MSDKIKKVIEAYNDTLEVIKCQKEIEFWLSKNYAYNILQEKCEEFKKALEFYAEGQHLEVPNFDNNLNETIVVDDGDVAREVLEKWSKL